MGHVWFHKGPAGVGVGVICIETDLLSFRVHLENKV